MNFFKRTWRLIKGKAHKGLSRIENSNRIDSIEMSIYELRRTLEDLKTNTIEQKADQVLLSKRSNSLSIEINKAADSAEKALLSGNETDAKNYIRKKILFEKEKENLDNTLAEISKLIQASETKIENVDFKIRNLTLQRNNLVGRLKVVNAKNKMNDILNTSGNENLETDLNELTRTVEKAELMVDFREEDNLSKDELTSEMNSLINNEMEHLKAKINPLKAKINPDN